MKKINVLVVDDHPIVKNGVFDMVKKSFENVQCHFSDNIRNAIAVVNQQHIDIIISDLEISNDSENDGFFLVHNLKKIEPRLKSIALTNYNSYRIMKKALAAGFNSFLDKSCAQEDFTQTIQQVYQNKTEEVYFSKSMNTLLKKKDVFYRNIFAESLYGLSDLSERELQLTILSTKTTDKHELSKLMQIHHTTVDTHFKNTLAKLQLKNRKELALFAEEFKPEIQKYIR